MNEPLLLHDSTKKNSKRFIKQPPHALLITGLPGSGKRAVAEHISAGMLGVEKHHLPNYPYFHLVEKADDKQDISIDAVRNIIGRLKLRTVIPSKGPVDRIVLIDGAHHMSREAQNALLKAVEEPPEGTTFVLTAVSESSVLPTIASRAQKLAVQAVTLKEAASFYGGNYPAQAVETAWQLSAGLSGLLNALLREDDNHPLKEAVETSKNLLRMNSYDRLLALDRLSSDKTELINLLDALSRILAVLHRAAVKAGDSPRSKRILQARKQVSAAEDSIAKNTSPKLAVMNLVLSLQI